MNQALFTEMNRVDPLLHPITRAANTYLSSYFSMAGYGKAVVLIETGTLTATATINAKLRQAKTSGGGSVKDITDKAITELTDADGSKIVAIELDASELDVSGDFEYVGLSVTTANANTILGAQLIRWVPQYAPVGVTQFDEVVT